MPVRQQEESWSHIGSPSCPATASARKSSPKVSRVLEAAARKFSIGIEWREFDWNCDYYAKHGAHDARRTGSRRSRRIAAIYYGAVGWPATVPDHVSLWGSLIQFRRRFDQYVNLRPCRLMPGIPSPLAGKKPGDVDFVVVRENTEGEYSSVGGRMFEGTEREIVFQESIFSRKGVDRILQYAFELGAKRKAKHVTSATKSNGISITMPYWDERFRAMAARHPGMRTDQFHIDISVAHFVLRPEIGSTSSSAPTSSATSCPTSDLAVCGTIGIAPSGNINPERKHPSLFEPVHGSAPDIAGKGIANPIGQIWSGALMLEHLGHADAAKAIVDAIERVLADPSAPRTAGHRRQGHDCRRWEGDRSSNLGPVNRSLDPGRCCL